MTEIRSGGTWGSALTTDEFAAVRGAGFEPVGQVFGAAVYGTGAASGFGCPGSFEPRVQALYMARRTAIDRMTAQCRGLGGHGVVGVRLTMGDFQHGGLEFSAIGTAVRARGVEFEPRAPFTSDVSGQDFAKLILAGWVPVGLALGVSIRSRHDDRTTTRQTRVLTGNTEVSGWTELLSHCRQVARRELADDVERLGADGVVIAAMRLRVRQRDCPVAVGRHDHVVEATLVGTAITPFARQRHPLQAVLMRKMNPPGE